MITVLAQDPLGGLELERRDGSWIKAPYIPGTFVVNIGDLMGDGQMMFIDQINIRS